MTLGPGGPLRVPSDKVAQYLLNVDHPTGGPKARYFLRFGFDPRAPDVMATALIFHAFEHGKPVPPDQDVPERIVIEGPLNSPDGRNPLVRCVWQREDGAELLRAAWVRPGSARHPPKG